MCWNQHVSWLTFILGTLLNVVCAWYSNTRHLLWYLLFQSVIMVQLGEALIWRDPMGGQTAKIGTYIAFFGVWLQPLIGFLLLYSFHIHPLYQILLSFFIIFYIVFSIPEFNRLQENIYVPICDPDSNGTHIYFKAWDNSVFMPSLYLLCSLFLLAITFPLYPFVSSYLILTMFLSMILYKRTFSSMWCWFAVVSPLICFLYQDIQINSFVSLIR